MYANINVQSIEDEGPNSFIFRMNDCRVQSARKQKLDDYPCKSAGLIEYTYFARPLISASKPNAFAALRTIIPMIGSARGGFLFLPKIVKKHHEVQRSSV